MEDIFLKNLPSLDLHGYDRETARVATEDFIGENIILKNDKIISSGVKKELLNNISKIKTSKVEIPKIIDFINAVKKKKNINLELTFDVKELMKDIYRNVK